jgi:hypothetical protein
MNDSAFTIEPNPPVAGQPATVTYTGDRNEVIWQVDGQPMMRIKVPPAKFPIDPVPSGIELCVSDGTGGKKGSLCVEIDNHSVEATRRGRP